MAQTPAPPNKHLSVLASSGGKLVNWLTIYAIPLAILVLSLVAIWGLAPSHGQFQGRPLHAALSSEHSPLDPPGTVLNTLSRAGTSAQPMVVEDASWVLLPLRNNTSQGDIGINFQGPLARTLTCWETDGLTPVGTVRAGVSATDTLQLSRQGIALFLDDQSIPAALLCHVDFLNDGYLSVTQWDDEALHQQLRRYERSASLLEGGLLTIALFIGVIAFTNREWVYLILSAWMLGNLRIGAMALGWDDQWLGRHLPIEWLPLLRNVTLASYYLLSYHLVTLLLKGPHSPLLQSLLRVAQWAGLALFAGAWVLPDAWFQPLLWAASLWGLVLLAGMLGVAAYRARAQRLWLWHLLLFSFALVLMGTTFYVLFFGRTPFTDSLNGALILLLSNVMVALTVAERMRDARRRRLKAQTALVSNHGRTPIGLFSLSPDGVFVAANPVLESTLGFSLSAGHLRRWTDYFETVNWNEVTARTQSGEDIHVRTRQGVLPDDRELEFIVRAVAGPEGIDGSLQDASARARSLQRMGQLADFDPLTDTLNHRGLIVALTQLISELREGMPTAVAYLNLRFFKRINDLFGHAVGDQILRMVAERLKTILEDRHPLARVGGDEFAVLLKNTRLDEASRIGNDMIQALAAEPFQVGSRSFQLSGIVGIIALNRSMTAEEALSAASHACRDARRRKQQMAIYEEDSLALQEHSEELRLFDQIEGGNTPSGLYLEMQPILSLTDPLAPYDIEVLLRARDPSGMPIASSKFLGNAEDSGTITTLDKWVFSATLDWLARHRNRLGAVRSVHVNLSGVSLNDEKFVTSLFSLLSRHEYLCSRLVVEITESVALQSFDRARQLIERLVAMGVHVALDDFGAGYTSFAYLKELPAESIKIDGSLIRDMLHNPGNTAIVRAIVQMAKSLNKTCIAEWVEDIETLKALQGMGVDAVQGFVVSKARPPVDILTARNVADLTGNRDTLAWLRQTP